MKRGSWAQTDARPAAAAKPLAAIREATGVEAKLSAGDGGIFDVHCDGELLFSKHAEGRYPSEDEIVEALRR